MSMAGAIKAVLNTPLLTDDGQLSTESEIIIDTMQPTIAHMTADIVSTETAENNAKFEVILKSAGAFQTKVIKIVRKINGLDLSDALALVKATPVTIKKCISKADADALAAQLTEAGAEVEVE